MTTDYIGAHAVVASQMRGIVDIFASQCVLLMIKGSRATCKRLWAQWLTGAGRARHVEYVLTYIDLHPEILYMPACTGVLSCAMPTGMRIMHPTLHWGTIKLQALYECNHYIAGLNISAQQCDYSVRVSSNDAEYQYIITKYDHAEHISVMMNCRTRYPSISISSVIIIGAPPRLTITTISKTYIFDMTLVHTMSRYLDFEQCTVTLATVTTEHVCILSRADAEPILKLVEFMASPRLDIVAHLPPLAHYDELIRKYDA